MTPDPDILNDVEAYYSGKLREHGVTPRGVDWNSELTQRVRFEQLMRVAPDDGPFSLNDFGCGYGALLDDLKTQGADVEYRGFDISEDMVLAGRSRHPGVHFTAQLAELPPADYTVASGIFNVALGVETGRWEGYIHETLHKMRALSTKGFAFNMLTSYSDEDRKRSDLHYASPTAYFDLCKREWSRNVALLHDYELYEFTIVVRL